jgi:hypothetical protein
MAPVEKHRRSAVGSGKLKPPRRRLIGRLYLGHHTGQRAVSQTVLGKRQNLAILAALRIKDLVGSEPHLFEARCIEVEFRQRP